MSPASAARRPTATFEIRADCTVGCDGRHSTVRAAAELAVEDVGAPIDVLWFRVGRDPKDNDSSLARIVPGHFLVTIDRGDYWQCAFVIPKGGADDLRRAGHRRLPRAGRRHRADAGGTHRRGRPLVGRRQAAHGRRRPADALVEAGAALHRRRGARDVAGRRRRHQPGDPGRGRRRRTCSPPSCATAASTPTTSTRCASAGSGRPRRRRRCRSRSRTTSWCRCSAAPTPSSKCRCRSASSPRAALQRVFARLLGMGVRPEHVRSPVA